MPIEIPRNIDLDERIAPRFQIKIDWKRLKQLQLDDHLIYPVEFGLGDQIDPISEKDKIPSFRFEPIEPDGTKITFTVITARTFDWNIIVNRGDLFSQDALNKINRHLRNGRLSRCQVYDALFLWEHSKLLWDNFESKDTENDYRWIGVEPFTTDIMRYAIFQLRKDSNGKICLLVGDHSDQTSFSSRCPIVLRYESTRWGLSPRNKTRPLPSIMAVSLLISERLYRIQSGRSTGWIVAEDDADEC
jgi:hypothetical protein